MFCLVSVSCHPAVVMCRLIKRGAFADGIGGISKQTVESPTGLLEFTAIQNYSTVYPSEYSAEQESVLIQCTKLEPCLTDGTEEGTSSSHLVG